MTDYIIVGGGSSACVAANRLVKKYGASVLMLEAGYADNHPLFSMPAGFIKMLAGSKYLTFHHTKPQSQLGQRVHDIPQGNVLGGGSTVNAMVYMRGCEEDYQSWHQAVEGDGWSYQDVLPYYVQQEGNQRLNNELHGIDGPLKVSDPVHICDMSYLYLQTMQTMDVPLTQDFNSGKQFGTGLMQTTTYKGRRCSASKAFLSEIKHEKKFELRLGAKVTRILFLDNTAIGVEYQHKGQTYTVKANKEVLLAAGALVTPQLLMLSGIGDKHHIADHQIDVIQHLPGVGQNLQDHHEVPVVVSTKEKLGYFGEDRGLKMIKNGLQFLLLGNGPVSSNGCEACSFINPIEPEARPTIQHYCVPTVYLDRDVMGIAPTHGATFNACVIQPKSRGSVRLASNRHQDKPIVDSNYLSHPDDMALQIAGFKCSREILNAPPLCDVVKEEIFPGPNCVSDGDIEAHCKRTVKTNYHPVGTCKMGVETDEFAVVDSHLRVFGVKNLRVIDASIMPTIISANTNAPAMMIADYAIDRMMNEQARSSS
ncbi:putative Choline dehydrogenase [Vibrio nigripulchritudo SO65]|uniref:GMC family oxidoreductase n=1 Tax=Vibrio nigripulchritudo TaxID=28173 RepID=UPI0003B1AD94|nr:GMC family oxidoreductase N-terminal domain-containing protein [Vibrio nigripulchritudo]CCN36180.1 putative Choline dehydrogenase [Vibrio nigripulchritudo AM115]CCN43514.1 putative Choline dehydrogenase [Vibrio nigripulchritudo FTn2]CCN66064.1 putative Choline dehydrogenase [Vibrio nigripulchritudo POn4]CCN78694.1 putative Choline dehydrogenase [Vibrio nigripulchritudo SO65]